MPGQSSTGSAEGAKQGAEMGRNWAWIEAGVWTERMLSALGNGVKGGK
jgi:RNA-directed DNA polymerase